ncbi:hypothetical protein [Zooshikella ganghwensis]|uniref:hypothetical protein n=1 Tax=Zooshikella ganghwensis TaxID=202772 RepID=UPI00041E4301|nr:hypothetical protein [Zooshikella ganghwensis]
MCDENSTLVLDGCLVQSKSRISSMTFRQGVVLSLCLHVLVFGIVYKVGLFSNDKTMHQGYSKKLIIEIVNKSARENVKQSSAVKKARLIASDGVLQKSKVVNNSKANNLNKEKYNRSKKEELIVENAIAISNKKQNQKGDHKSNVKVDASEVSSQTKRISYGDILKQVEQLDSSLSSEDDLSTSNTLIRENFTVFSKQLRNKLNVVDRKKKERYKYLEGERVKEENKYFEFGQVGDTKVVRINGNCFGVPEEDPFSLFQETWELMGDCSKKQLIKFEAKTLNKQYQEMLRKNSIN